MAGSARRSPGERRSSAPTAGPTPAGPARFGDRGGGERRRRVAGERDVVEAGDGKLAGHRDAKNTQLPNGHNRQTPSLPISLPGNGSLLAAVALMAAGWEGGPPAPGFPTEGWDVRHEGLHPSP
ncbi:hypothetical protein GCM10023170_049880 [Phytohabitans houttuyneae]|uniref:Uncharacterized protein n=1 Tax=Phytohabitans houttuyneae TaxID=1076126 RepID=A0A6V8KIP0_9ACTN|nr:hypothetical protein Phou_092520 [Phytohabitans houttuyneae]